MIDYRIETFLKLCETLNYRVTAEILNMTQPAVTQHIKFLEREYNSKLFLYSGKKLTKTSSAILLEEYARTAIFNEKKLRLSIENSINFNLNIGATKTIGEFLILDKINNFLENKNNTLNLKIDNTKVLLNLLDNNKIDFAMIEGYFDKNKYDYKLFKEEKFIGICSKNHKFANKKIKFKDIFNETLILREEGSGTRDIFNHILVENNFSLDNFNRKISINNFAIIKELVIKNKGISFVYESIAKTSDDLQVFYIEDIKISHELNYVFLKNTKAIDFINLFNKNINPPKK